MIKNEINHQRELLGNGTDPEFQLLFSLTPEYDRNRYNLRRVNEVAAVFSTTADGDIPELYVTIRNKDTRVLRAIDKFDGFKCGTYGLLIILSSWIARLA